MLLDLLNRSLHPALILAWKLRLLWRGLTGKPLTGAQVLVWYNRSILLIKNSYRTGYFLPGGGISRNEEPVSAAVRELMEETGIKVSKSELRDLGPVHYEIEGVPVRDHLFTVTLGEFKKPEIDGLEVIDANFFELSKALKVTQLRHLHHLMQPGAA